MDKWVAFAAKDKEILSQIDGEVKTGGTANRLRWNTKAKDGSTILATSEPKKKGTASIIITQMGLESSELNTQAKEKWSGIAERFAKSL